MKTVMLNGIAYPAKRLYVIGLRADGAHFARRTNGLLYEKGMMSISFSNKESIIASTDFCDESEHTHWFDVGFCLHKSGEYELIFFNDEWKLSWEHLFIFFIGSEGSCLLYASKNTYEKLGVVWSIFDTDHEEEAMIQALTISDFLGEDIHQKMDELLRTKVPEVENWNTRFSPAVTKKYKNC